MLKENYIYLDVNAKTKEQMLKFIADKAIENDICDSSEGLLEDLKKEKQSFQQVYKMVLQFLMLAAVM